MIKAGGKSKPSVLITGAAGFIGSNLVEYFLDQGYNVLGLDNFATGFKNNILEFISHPQFSFYEGDIRDLETCMHATSKVDYVLHQAALGSVPRSLNKPLATNSTNVNGFLNMLVAAKEAKVKRFVYATSSSTYGDSTKLPKVEHEMGNPLSPYAVTKVINELYADVFAMNYGMECVGLRYFNVFGKKQDPNGAYAAVIPLWAKLLISHRRPIINGDENYSRDFTYIDNVLLANELALTTPAKQLKTKTRQYIHQVFNVAYGSKTSLKELFLALRDNLSRYDPEIATIEPIVGPQRKGDVPHSLASIEKARRMLGYNPLYNTHQGFGLVSKWYYDTLHATTIVEQEPKH
jgi:UDP-N-acetylglucosamine 4-epimerase